jgi:hypothetical protein
MNKELTDRWLQKRGIIIETITMNPPTLTPEDM